MVIPLTDRKNWWYNGKGLIYKIWATSNIGQNGHFFEKGEPKISPPLSCLSSVAEWNAKWRSKFNSLRSSHRCSIANAKCLFWNTTTSFSFEAYRQLILYFTISHIFRGVASNIGLLGGRGGAGSSRDLFCIVSTNMV